MATKLTATQLRQWSHLAMATEVIVAPTCLPCLESMQECARAGVAEARRLRIPIWTDASERDAMPAPVKISFR